eukprot:15484649-Alexandrium_andersonii.AAC.1
MEHMGIAALSPWELLHVWTPKHPASKSSTFGSLMLAAGLRLAPPDDPAEPAWPPAPAGQMDKCTID